MSFRQKSESRRMSAALDPIRASGECLHDDLKDLMTEHGVMAKAFRLIVSLLFLVLES